MHLYRNKALTRSIHSQEPPLSLCFPVSFLRAGDARGGSFPSTKEITAGCGSTYTVDGHGTAIQGGSQCPEQHEEGGDPQADRRERKTQGQSSVVLGQSSS